MSICTTVVPGSDSARVQSWVAAQRSTTKPATLTIGHARYYFSYPASERSMTLIVSYLGTAG